MRRLSIAAAAGALACGLVPVAAKAQSRAIRAARRRGQGAGGGRLHGVPRDRPDHAQLRLRPGGLAGADRHDGRPGRQPEGTRHHHRIPRDAFPAERRAGRPS